MAAMFPTQREAKRKLLLEAVVSIKGTLEAHAEESEASATLAPASALALQESGLFAMKLPAALGGAEADPLLQMELIEAVARIHPSAAWCLMIGATSVAFPGAFLPDKAVAEIFGNGIPLASTVNNPMGRAVPVAGGYVLNGRWPYASGIRHSQWVTAASLLRIEGQPSDHRMFTMPVSKVQIHDNWDVLGLQGTGSCDFSVTDVFVPQEFTWSLTHDQPRRGGPIYRMGRPAFVAYEHASFATGVARLALDAITALAQEKRRGYATSPDLIANRPVFQHDLAQCDLKARAARALSRAVYQAAWDMVCATGTLSPRLQAETRSSAAYATAVADEVVNFAFRYGGASSNYRSSILQRCLRDINAAAQHRQVMNVSYEDHARFMLELPEASALG